MSSRTNDACPHKRTLTEYSWRFARITSSVPGGSINTVYYLRARGESSYCRVITHDESKLREGRAQPRAPPVRIRRPRELRGIWCNSTCLWSKYHFGISLGVTCEKRRINPRDTRLDKRTICVLYSEETTLNRLNEKRSEWEIQQRRAWSLRLNTNASNNISNSTTNNAGEARRSENLVTPVRPRSERSSC